MVAAEEINVVWKEIQTYFHELNISLTRESSYWEIVFTIVMTVGALSSNLGSGIRFVKEIFCIQVVKIHPGLAELMVILEF